MNLGRLINSGGIALLCAVGVLSALIEVLLIPLRDGTFLVPLTVVLAVLGNVVFPRLARVFVDTSGAMVVTFLAWLLPLLVLVLLPRPEGDVLVRGGGGEQWVFYGVLLGGAIAGTSTIVLHGAAPRAVGRPRSAGRPYPDRRRPMPREHRGR
ncbi:MAG: hypothetical protein ACRDWT_17585 [Jatrophihabitantaceae bacterium]